MYMRARKFRMELKVDGAFDEAENPRMGQRLKKKANGQMEAIAGDNVERSRLIIDTIKWAAAKLMPRKYGDHPANSEGKEGSEDKLAAAIERSALRMAEAAKNNGSGVH
jgi:hypothetical protein